MPTTEPLLYSVRDTARLLAVSARTIYNLIERGDVRAVELGGRKLVPKTEIDRIVGDGTVGSP